MHTVIMDVQVRQKLSPLISDTVTVPDSVAVTDPSASGDSQGTVHDRDAQAYAVAGDTAGDIAGNAQKQDPGGGGDGDEGGEGGGGGGGGGGFIGGGTGHGNGGRDGGVEGGGSGEREGGGGKVGEAMVQHVRLRVPRFAKDAIR